MLTFAKVCYAQNSLYCKSPHKLVEMVWTIRGIACHHSLKPEHLRLAVSPCGGRRVNSAIAIVDRDRSTNAGSDSCCATNAGSHRDQLKVGIEVMMGEELTYA